MLYACAPQVRALCKQLGWWATHRVWAMPLAQWADHARRLGLASPPRRHVHTCGFVFGVTRRLHSSICGMPTAAEALAAVDPSQLRPRPLLASRPGVSYKFEVHQVVRFLRGSQHLRRLSSADQAASDILSASFPALLADVLKEHQDQLPCRSFSSMPGSCSTFA